MDQLQVRTVVGDANDRHGIWEIVHCHSEKEGRPKKVYQYLRLGHSRRHLEICGSNRNCSSNVAFKYAYFDNKRVSLQYHY